MKSLCLLTTKIWKATIMQKLRWFGGLGVIQGHWQHRHLIERYDFLFDFNRNYASILYHFRVIARFSSKVANFNHTTDICRPRREWSRPNFAVNFGVRKLESWGYRTAVFAWSYVQPFWYNNGVWQTDTQTHTETHIDTRRRHIPLLA